MNKEMDQSALQSEKCYANTRFYASIIANATDLSIYAQKKILGQKY